jgi:hypothetical protein
MWGLGDGVQDLVRLAPICLIGCHVVGKNISVLPLKFPVILLYPCTIFLGHPPFNEARGESLGLILFCVQAENEVGVHGSVSVQAGQFELMRISEGSSVCGFAVYGVSTPFVAVGDGLIGGIVAASPRVVVFLHHDDPGRDRGVYDTGVAPPTPSVGVVGVGTGGARPLLVAPLTDGAVRRLNPAVAVSTSRGRVR